MNAGQERQWTSDEEDAAREPLAARAGRALRPRWVQAVLTVFCGVALIGLSAAILKPKKQAVSNPKYLRCSKCDYEIKYADDKLGSDCMHCRTEPMGRLEPQPTSIKDELTRKSPWRWFHLAAAFEGILTIAGLLYVLKRPKRDFSTTYYVFSCPNCGQRLRFRHVSLGGLGQCSRCKRPVRFPTEESAVLEEDLIREEQKRLEAEADQEDED